MLVFEGSSPVVLDKPRSSFSAWNLYQKQSLTSPPWCKLLSQSALVICAHLYYITEVELERSV